MNYRRGLLLRMALLLSLPLTILAIPHFWRLMTLPLSQQEMKEDLIGQWCLIVDNPTWVGNRTYEFFADGRYIEKSRTYELIDMSQSMWLNKVFYGHYKVTPGNKLNCTTERTFVQGELCGGSGGSSGILLSMNWNKTIVQIDKEYFRRVTP